MLGIEKISDTIKMSQTDIQTEGIQNMSEAVGLTLNAYMEMGQKFLMEHECIDCPAYELHTKILDSLRTIFIEVGSKELEKIYAKK